jgi:UDP-glucuronate 4-epimerase
VLVETVKMPCNEDVLIHPSNNLSVAQSQLQNKPGTNIETWLKKFAKWYLSYYGHNTTS